jgi:hypothetical protein
MEFEIHITIENSKGVSNFIADCSILNVKPVLIHLGDNEQLMTSSKHRYNGDMRDILVPLYTKLQFDMGYRVLRLKVEKKPEPIKDINFKYYETHFRLSLPKNYDYEVLNKICDEFDFHLSKNLFKVDDNYDYQMITYRTKEGGLSQFNMVINQMREKLNEFTIKYDKVEIEECIFDTNEELDYRWLNKK